MTPKPPSSSDGSPLPPRHRPSLGNLAKDTTELDLWAFEDDLDPQGELEEPRADPAARPSSRDIPAPREKTPSKQRESDERQGPPKTPTGGEDRIRMNVNKPRSKGRPGGSPAGQSKPERDFDDLEHWEDAKTQPEIEELPLDGLPESLREDEDAAIGDVISREVEPQKPVIPTPEIAGISPGSAAADDEFSPVRRDNAQPISLRPHLGLSKVERIGLISLVALLIVGAVLVVVISLNRLPTESIKAEANDFPIKGTRLEVKSATSYWRPPITEGPDADTFRRDTQLLPVVELDMSGGPAAIRVLFRNEERTVVGDAVTRSVQKEGMMKIAATAGFDDLGMHAAYRTGESKPWTIEVYEAPTEDTAGKDFLRLFEMNISTDRR